LDLEFPLREANSPPIKLDNFKIEKKEEFTIKKFSQWDKLIYASAVV